MTGGQGSWWDICWRNELWEMANCGILEEQGPSV